MDRQLPRNKIRFGRKDVTVLPNADDLARMFQFAQSFPHRNTVPALQSERSCDLVSIARPVIRLAQQGENFFSNCAAVLGHVGETISEILDLTNEFEG